MIAKASHLKRRAVWTAITLASLWCHSTPLSAANNLELYSAYCDILHYKYDIKAAEAGICAREGDRVQAAARPNPIFNASLDSIGGLNCEEENELFVGVIQLFELGGKRPARMDVACANRTASQWNAELQKNELYADLIHAFITLSAAQERLILAEGQKKLAEQVTASVATKAAKGKTAGIEEMKAQLSFKSVLLSFQRQQAQLNKAKRELIAFWDNCPPCFDGVSFPLHTLAPLPDYCCLSSMIANTPRMALAQAETSIASNVTALERANAVPDVAIQIGVNTEKFTRRAALYAGFEVPIPIFDRNKGNISRASYEQMQAVYKQMDTENHLEAALSVIYGEWASAYEQALTLKETILPAAEETFRLAQASYEEGKFDYLHLLDARRTLFEIQEQYLDAIEEYHHKRAEVIRITAGYPS